MGAKQPISEAEFESLQRDTFDYFVHEANPANGLIIDKTEPNWPASIAATGLALACYPVGVEPGSGRVAPQSGVRWPLCAFFGIAHRARSAMQPGIAGSTIISLICRPGVASGTANCQPSTAHS